MKDTISNLSIVGFIAVILLMIAAIILWPLVLIAALNTLFITLSIPYTFWTWASMVVIQMSTFGALASILKKIEKKLSNKHE